MEKVGAIALKADTVEYRAPGELGAKAITAFNTAQVEQDMSFQFDT